MRSLSKWISSCILQALSMDAFGIYFDRKYFYESFSRSLGEWWSAVGDSLPCRVVYHIISGITLNHWVMSDMTWQDVGGVLLDSLARWCSVHSTPVYGPALSQWSSSSAALFTSPTHYTLSQWSSSSAALFTSLTNYTLSQWSSRSAALVTSLTHYTL